MGARNLKGIEGFFSDYEKTTTPPNTRPVVAESEKTSVEGEAKPDTVTGRQDSGGDLSERDTASRPSLPSAKGAGRLPLGRPPGPTNKNKRSKTKASVWLDSELWQDYRNRVFEERCQLGELIERALREYRRRNWGQEESASEEFDQLVSAITDRLATDSIASVKAFAVPRLHLSDNCDCISNRVERKSSEKLERIRCQTD